MSKRTFIALGFLLGAALPMRADFDGVVRAIQRTRGMHRVSVPFLGVARFAVWIAHPKGVYDFQLATFEGDSVLDGASLNDILRSNAGAGFRPIVQVHSNRSGEWTFIYARPSGKQLEIMLVTHDHDDTVAVRAVVDPDRVLDDPHHAVRIARR